MPWIILGVGSFALSAMSFIKDTLKEAGDSGDEASNVLANLTLLMVAGVGVYLVSQDKLKIK